MAHAEAYTGEYVGVWILKKIILVRPTQEKPLLKIGNVMDETNNRLELTEREISLDEARSIPFKPLPPQCLLGVDTDGDSTPEKSLAGFIAAAGGKVKLDQLLRKNTGVSFEKIRHYWLMQAIPGSKPPCSNIWKADGHLAEKSFYFTQDKKKFFLFIDPYIYYFSGGYGPITGSH